MHAIQERDRDSPHNLDDSFSTCMKKGFIRREGLTLKRPAKSIWSWSLRSKTIGICIWIASARGYVLPSFSLSHVLMEMTGQSCWWSKLHSPFLHFSISPIFTGFLPQVFQLPSPPYNARVNMHYVVYPSLSSNMQSVLYKNSLAWS